MFLVPRKAVPVLAIISALDLLYHWRIRAMIVSRMDCEQWELEAMR